MSKAYLEIEEVDKFELAATAKYRRLAGKELKQIVQQAVG